MKELVRDVEGRGHPIRVVEIDADDVTEHPSLMEAVFRADVTGVVIRGALKESVVRDATARLESAENAARWASPNQGMPGGELRTIGDAATPTFTAFRGPPAERYGASAAQRHDYDEAAFGGDGPLEALGRLFSGLSEGRPSGPPAFDEQTDWLPYNFRALDPGVQIYSHHDDHYGLPIYEHMDERYDRSVILSWFVTLQPAEVDGQLIVYGLWGSDPDPPMLPTRFLDTQALEDGYKRYAFNLGAGDLVVFNSGRYVHRVSPVRGNRPRVTLGGFLTADVERTEVVFWS